MKKNIMILILVVVFILLMVGAYVLYDRLSQQVDTQQLATRPPETTSPENTAPHTESQPASSESAPEQIPDFTVYDAQGNEVHLHDFFGKPIVLNFWASWCGPCKMEMPHFQEKYDQLGNDVLFLMVNMTDGSRETVDIASSFITEQGYTFPVFYDTASDAAMTYSVYSLPTTYFIDAQGVGQAYATGAIDADMLQQGIDMIS